MVGFIITALTSLAVLAATVYWAAADESFAVMLEVARIILHFQEHPGCELRSSLKWNQLGARLVCLIALSTIGIISFSMLVWCVAQLAEVDHHFLAAGAPLIVGGLWLTFILVYRRTNRFGYARRLARDIPQFRAALQEVTSCWPTTSGILPSLGHYNFDSKYPNLLLFPDCGGFPWRIGVGPFLTRLSARAFRFDLNSDLTAKLEYRSNGDVPTDYTDTLSGRPIDFRIEHLSQIDATWYFAVYKMDVGNMIQISAAEAG